MMPWQVLQRKLPRRARSYGKEGPGLWHYTCHAISYHIIYISKKRRTVIRPPDCFSNGAFLPITQLCRCSRRREQARVCWAEALPDVARLCAAQWKWQYYQFPYDSIWLAAADRPRAWCGARGDCGWRLCWSIATGRIPWCTIIIDFLDRHTEGKIATSTKKKKRQGDVEFCGQRIRSDNDYASFGCYKSDWYIVQLD